MTRNKADQVVRVILNNLIDFTEFDNLFSELEIFENLRFGSFFRKMIVDVAFSFFPILSSNEIFVGFVEFSV